MKTQTTNILTTLAAALLVLLMPMSSALAQTPASNEAQIQSALAEQKRMQRCADMMSEWIDALLSLRRYARVQHELLISKIRRDRKDLINEGEQVKLEAQLRGQPIPPSVAQINSVCLASIEAEIDANYIYADGKPKNGWKAWKRAWDERQALPARKL
jgi:hypothetical protein